MATPGATGWTSTLSDGAEFASFVGNIPSDEPRPRQRDLLLALVPVPEDGRRRARRTAHRLGPRLHRRRLQRLGGAPLAPSRACGPPTGRARHHRPGGHRPPVDSRTRGRSRPTTGAGGDRATDTRSGQIDFATPKRPRPPTPPVTPYRSSGASLLPGQLYRWSVGGHRLLRQHHRQRLAVLHDQQAASRRTLARSPTGYSAIEDKRVTSTSWPTTRSPRRPADPVHRGGPRDRQGHRGGRAVPLRAQAEPVRAGHLRLPDHRRRRALDDRHRHRPGARASTTRRSRSTTGSGCRAGDRTLDGEGTRRRSATTATPSMTTWTTKLVRAPRGCRRRARRQRRADVTVTRPPPRTGNLMMRYRACDEDACSDVATITLVLR